MNAAKQAAWLCCLLLVLAGSGLYFASAKPIKRLDDTALSKTADMIISNLTVMRFDEKGKLINYLHSPEAQHIPENNTHFFKSPRLSLAQENQPDWEISSQTARAINGGEKITFSHNVVVHQDKNKRGQESTLKTEELHYFSKTKIANTDLDVSFEQPGNIVHSKGMKANLEEKRIQLLSQAHATFEPTKHG
ncbi:Organic solvent tolerance protein OstA [Legionella massiliensis]|uniref:Organic solvent tolerance protein OstA n=1 Tax=Legionella massiliensis TaxID=1034943 RepID=A0A078L428_9GAMM|nr:LPS export ABC transporter periplasmic protein LptC [Legionella massiliensis]CDZ78698.1 Organic solvent tolerance protein OstA [Legionella massiliensis]CEE14436.1 Lipopolysaccharide-assembly, LptC-related [Legionella massiliensis]